MSADANALFQPFRLGDLTLPNRLVMAPLTRNRAAEGDVPQDITATYYAQRASAGLLISEGSQISHQGQGYLRTPGIYTPEQVEHWRKVTDKVHTQLAVTLSVSVLVLVAGSPISALAGASAARQMSSTRAQGRWQGVIAAGGSMDDDAAIDIRLPAHAADATAAIDFEMRRSATSVRLVRDDL